MLLVDLFGRDIEIQPAKQLSVITFQDLLNIFEDYNPQAKFVIYNKKTRTVLGSAVGYDGQVNFHDID